MRALDRRQTERDRRRALRAPAVFAVKSQVSGRMLLAQAEDVGPAGMTLRRPKDVPFPPHTPVVLTFSLPGDRGTIGATGVVVSDRFGGSFRRTGVRFTRLAPADHQRLMQFCLHTLGLAWAPMAAVAG